MARQDITVQQIIDKYPSLPLSADAADFTFAASDPTNGDQFPLTGKEIIIVQNSDAANPHTVTIHSVADPYRRTGDITNYSIGAGEFAVFPAFPKEGWAQADGMLYLDSDDAQIKYAVLRLPN